MSTNATLTNTLYHILIVDDDEDDFFITSEYIKNIPEYKFVIDWAYDYKDGLKYISDKKHDLYIVDYYLGAKTGLDFIKDAIKECNNPIILLTGKGNHEIDKEVIDAGAIDYLIKSELDTEKLERCIRHSLQHSKAMKALRASEMKYRHIFQNSVNAIFLTDENLFFKDANLATLKLLEVEKEAIIGKGLYDFMPSSFNKNMLKLKLAANEDINVEVEFVSKSKNVKHCVLYFSKELDNEGNVYLQGIVHDISNLKKEEKEKIYREKLNLAERIARTFAHEVRNPLNNIGLAAEQLGVEGFELNKARVFIDIINRNTKRIGEIVTELLKVSPNIEISNKSLQLLIDESIDAAKDRMLLKRIKFTKHYPDNPVIAKMDFNKLKIAFLNLIINAIEAMEPGKGELTISLEDKDNHAAVIIHDNGCGIKEENLPHLFDPYYTEKKSGLGLGLSSTQNIISLHEGTINVTSNLNTGTSFIITIPK